MITKTAKQGITSRAMLMLVLLTIERYEMSIEQIRNELHRLNKLYIAKLQERTMARVPALREELSQQLEDIDSQICGLTQLITEDCI